MLNAVALKTPYLSLSVCLSLSVSISLSIYLSLLCIFLFCNKNVFLRNEYLEFLSLSERVPHTTYPWDLFFTIFFFLKNSSLFF